MNSLKLTNRKSAVLLAGLIILTGFTGYRAHAQSMGISSSSITPDASSILEIRTTTKGLLIPRMTTTERDAISSPATGLMVFNTTTGKFNFYSGSAWLGVFSGTGGVNSVTGTSNRVTIGGTSADPTIDISSSYVGQSSITTLGTIATGTWNGTLITSAYGGTGNGFTKFTGATSSEKTFTLPNASATILTDNAVVTVPQGGIGVGTLTSNGVLYGNGTGAVQALPVNSTATVQYLSQVSSGTPTWVTPTNGTVTSVSGTANRITVATGTTTPVIDISGSYVGQGSITTLGTIGTGVWNGTLVDPTYGGTGINNGSKTITLGGNLVTSGAFATTFTSTATTNATLPAGTNTLYSTKSASISSAQLLTSLSDPTGTGVAVFGTSPTLATPVINGLATGTGVASAATASTLVARDANINISANNALLGYTTTATAAGTTTLTVGSAYSQYFTGSTTQTVTLPVASTLVLGQQFFIVNNSTGVVTVQSSGANTVQAMSANSYMWVTCILTSGTSAASWNVSYKPATATALATGRTIGMTGDVTWTSPAFDGSANVTAGATVTAINGTSLAGLATGILKNTTTTGVPSIAVAGDFPTLNQNTTGSAATLTTSRSIYGNNFNGSADLTQIIASAYGGTGNGFTKFTGPVTSEKTFTLPNASATILTDNAVITAAQGGTGNASYTIGDILYASGSTTLSKLADVATGNVLISGGTSTAPSWGKVALTTHVSGILPIANGGTNSTTTPTTGGIAFGDGSAYQFTAAGTTGQILQSAGTGTPIWVDGGAMMSGVSNNTAVNNTTLFFPITGAIAGNATDASAGLRTLVSRAGTVKNFHVRISAALAAGKTGTVTVYKNGVATALAVTLSVGPILFSDTSNSFTVAAGDEVGVQVSTTGNVKFSWAASFTF